MGNKRLTIKCDSNEYIVGVTTNGGYDEDVVLEKQYEANNKLGQLEDLEEEIGVNDLIHFLKWCVKFRDNFINRSFDSMVAFYKKAMCEIEKDKSE